LGTFKIKNLATSNCVKDWDKEAPPIGARVGKLLPGLGQGMLNHLGKVRLC